MTEENRFGGERLDSAHALSKNNLIEHLIRYEFIPGDKNATILDIGCGSGHGSATLAAKFRHVDAVDVSDEALVYAETNWKRDNITYTVGDGLAIPFPDDTFDVVAAFEVFEHVTDWRGFLREIVRVLKPNGKAYISTPNKTLYSPGTKKPINPHHVFEMTIPEFKSAMEEFFELEA